MKKIVSYPTLLEKISHLFQKGQAQAVQAVNKHLMHTYWTIR